MSDMFLPLKRYFQFSGRSRRREYWLFMLLLIIGSFVFGFLDIALGLGGDVVTSTGDVQGEFSASAEANGGVLTLLWSLATLIPTLSVAVRRLHDTDRRGWWLLIGIIPLIGTIVLIVFFCLRGTSGPNRFGSDPKGLSEEEAADVFS
ncbi:DUF805 domain-containing protein [Fulvimarina sp. MAC3]|uniref:DUF805 domain-containing protein n=1 Tax=Fulvimarina sp. MAC3 TaxID=3148887 RepID=UPI0031FD52FD